MSGPLLLCHRAGNSNLVPAAKSLRSRHLSVGSELPSVGWSALHGFASTISFKRGVVWPRLAVPNELDMFNFDQNYSCVQGSCSDVITPDKGTIVSENVEGTVNVRRAALIPNQPFFQAYAQYSAPRACTDKLCFSPPIPIATECSRRQRGLGACACSSGCTVAVRSKLRWPRLGDA